MLPENSIFRKIDKLYGLHFYIEKAKELYCELFKKRKTTVERSFGDFK